MKRNSLGTESEIECLQARIAGARRILDCYSSPFPDAIERRKRAEQAAFVQELERQLRVKEKE